MKIAVYGAGYVGLVSAACLAKLGHQVINVDINKERIRQLKNGECPIFEEELPELLYSEIHAGRLLFTTNICQAVSYAEVHFIATGTPPLADGGIDLSQVVSIVREIATEATADGVLVIKSTVPVGTADAMRREIDGILTHSKKNIHLPVVSNPEFLREGSAVYDFLNPDRIIVGGDNASINILKQIYQPLIEQGSPYLTMNQRSAELCKYAANAMLATRISFINQISTLSEKFNANIDDIAKGIGMDHRIGKYFLNAGIGYGGSCFPKDVKGLIHIAESADIAVPLLKAIEEVNQIQKKWIITQLNKHFQQDLTNRCFAIWGLSFKPGTNDIREAISLVVIRELCAAGANLVVYDPITLNAARQVFKVQTNIEWCSHSDDVFNFDIDALIILTEWPEFQNYSLEVLKQRLGMRPLIDGRNCFELQQIIQAGLNYYSVGRKPFLNEEDGSSNRDIQLL